MTKKLFDDDEIRGAEFSPCRSWRYALWRIWDCAGPLVGFIGLNPSTADETIDDPTVRRCINFAKDWGYGGIYMLNAFAFRATDPNVMKAAADPVGPDNDAKLSEYARGCSQLIACWGIDGKFRGRDREIRQLPGLWNRLCVLKLTKDGHPNHPLYLPKTLQPIIWEAAL